LTLVIDTRASPNPKIKHKETEQQSICHYPAFQQYVASILAAPCKLFTAPRV